MSAKTVFLAIRVESEIKNKLDALCKKKELGISQLMRKVLKGYITAEEVLEHTTQKLGSEIETLMAEIQKLYAEIVECEKEKRDPAPLLAKQWELIKKKALLQKQLDSQSADKGLSPNVLHISSVIGEVR